MVFKDFSLYHDEKKRFSQHLRTAVLVLGNLGSSVCRALDMWPNQSTEACECIFEAETRDTGTVRTLFALSRCKMQSEDVVWKVTYSI